MIGQLRPHLRPRRRLGPARLTVPQALLLGVIVVLTVFPIYWMVVSSLKTNFDLLTGSRVSLLPDLGALQLQNYVLMWQRLNLAIRRSLYDVSLAQLAGLDPTQVRLPELEREMKTAATRGDGRPGVNR